MEKQTKTTYILFLSAIASVILHNLISAVFNTEEAVFFILSLALIPLAFLSVIFNTVTYLKRREPKDIWKLGFLGLLGFIGLVSNLNGAYGLFGLFGFFGMKNGMKRR